MKESPFACPECGAELPLADVNIGSDLALCRACGRKGPFLRASSVPAWTDEELARPPKGVTVRRDFGDVLTIEVRPSKRMLLFLVPFTAVWSGISITAIYLAPLARGEFDWKAGLFGLPFLAGTFGLVTAILYPLFGKTTVTLKKGRVTVRMGLFGLGRAREIAYGKGTRVSLGESGYKVNNVPQREIVLTSEGQDYKFGAMGLSGEAKKYVAAVLRRAAGGG